MDVGTLLDAIAVTPDCRVAAPAGLPSVARTHTLPPDLRTFYELCGGVSLFERATYPITVVPPEQVVAANAVILTDLTEEDIQESSDDRSWAWYIIARSGNEQFIVIDCAAERLGRCYDGFWDIYPGNSTIVATSFSSLLEHLFLNQGQHWYWLQPEFTPLGDAYE